MKYVAYYRVSTAKQGQSGLGLEAQRNTVETHISNLNGVIAGEYIEVSSGRNNDRKQLHEALKTCRLTGATLVIAKLDRLSRDRRFLMELADSKLNFICCDMPEANQLTIGIIAVMADYESKLISERTKVALKAAKARGVTLGNPKLNQVRNDDTSKARSIWAEQSQSRNSELLGVINELIAKHGNQSTRKLAGLLNEAGYTTARGKQFTSTQVHRLLNKG
jgi:DNA invertase Pin-like site-specific DNA recombinase